MLLHNVLRKLMFVCTHVACVNDTHRQMQRWNESLRERERERERDAMARSVSKFLT